jgi:transposase
MSYLGIDVSELKLRCTLLLGPKNDKCKRKVVANNRQGVYELIRWCAKHGLSSDQVHGVMDGTGLYHEQSATTLHDTGATVSLVNPENVHDFGQTRDMRSRTDGLDSLTLARYGVAAQPPTWQPSPAHVRALRDLVAQWEALSEDRKRSLNRLKKADASAALALVESSISNSLCFYDGEMARLERAIDDHIDHHSDLQEDAALLAMIPGTCLNRSPSRENC